jgi:hypothetical protein
MKYDDRHQGQLCMMHKESTDVHANGKILKELADKLTNLLPRVYAIRQYTLLGSTADNVPETTQ